MIHFLCPYGGHISWDELKYMLRSIDTNCLCKYDIKIITDSEIEWFVGKQIIIDYPYRGDYGNFYNTLYKLYYYSNNYQNEFIYIYDDHILNFKIENEKDFSILKNVALDYEDEHIIKYRNRIKGKHNKTILSAYNIISELFPGKKLYNYETHLPRIYNTKNINDLFNKFDILNIFPPPAFATLYFNYYYEQPDTILSLNDKNLKASFCFEDSVGGSYLPVNEREIYKYSDGKMWIHYNDKTLNWNKENNYIFRNFLSNKFPDKSKFEK